MIPTDAVFAQLELSSQLLVREALNRGIHVEILDYQDNIVRLTWDGRTEYVMQATRTSADTYISPLLMNNKAVSKQLLSEAGIRVPAGIMLQETLKTDSEINEFRQADWIIKPNSTNFGIGITRIPEGSSLQDIISAFELAFSHDSQVLVEEYIEGREYRFLVIDGHVRAILNRVPAHVVGDGIHSISELIADKNLDPRRGNGYKLPLEKLKAGEIEAAVLAESGLDFSSIPGPDETVYIRKNSNISTGGDGIDVTDSLHPFYSQIAVRSAETLGARICGVDIIIAEGAELREGDPEDYAVIELNFNPALHIHDFPTEGENRKVEAYVLDLLMQQG
ncbi:bifunctional glutamate--cysteine ligase GshA/glutathione synthetase GshB [Spirochaeta dissipatitropha]